MHPAFSVIFFTTASGAGYGLLIWLGVFGAAGLLPAERWLGFTGFGIAFALVTAGLLSSTFHLGHPERAWRALTQWRSSWLSREGIAAIVTYVPTGLQAIGWVFLERNDGVFAVLGLLGAVSAAATVYCTAMIYASLKSVPRWSNAWVPPAYIFLALATGGLLLAALAHLFSLDHGLYVLTAALALVIAAIVKLGYWRSTGRAPARSTAASATGLGKEGQTVRLLDAPHSEENYLLKEMGYRVARKHAATLRVISTVMLFAVPFVATIVTLPPHIGAHALPFAVIALISAAIGVVVERWLFFAEARHVVTLYYGEDSA